MHGAGWARGRGEKQNKTENTYSRWTYKLNFQNVLEKLMPWYSANKFNRWEQWNHKAIKTDIITFPKLEIPRDKKTSQEDYWSRTENIGENQLKILEIKTMAMKKF